MALAINSAGLGLKASVVNTADGSANPYKLVVTGETGASKNFTLTSDDGSGVGEQQTLTFGAATQSGNITVAGVNVAVTAGDSASVVAQKVATALTADSIVTGTSGRSATFLNPGKVVFTYAGSDGDVSDIAFRDAGSTGVIFSAAQSRAFSPGASVTGVQFTADATRPAQDAELVVDGISVKRGSNEIKDLISGVTLNLLGTTTGTASLSVNQDSTGLKDKLSELVKSYNNAISDFKILTGAPNEKDKTDVYSGSLQSDSTVSYVTSTLKNLFLRNSSTTSGSIKALRDVGISYQRDGTLSLDEAKLTESLAASPDAVVTMLTADRENKTYFGTANRGMAGDAIKTLNDMIATTGQINTQTTNANAQLTKFKDKLAALDERFTLLQTRYAKQFAVMDSFVGQTNSLKTSLQSSFAGMMSMYTNKN
jgi:flagellar hook-associated protein 2